MKQCEIPFQSPYTLYLYTFFSTSFKIPQLTVVQYRVLGKNLEKEILAMDLKSL